MIADNTISLLQRLFTLMNSSAGPHAIFAGTADTALAVLEADGVVIMQYDDVRNSFSLVTARHISLEAQVLTVQSLTRRVQVNPTWLSHLQTITNWCEQLRLEEDYIPHDMTRMAGMMSIPMRSGKGDLLGVLVVFYNDPYELSGKRQVVASLLGALASSSLDNARLYESERRRADFMAEVLRAGSVLQVDQPVKDVLQQLVGIISRTLGWQTVVVVMADFDTGFQHLAAWVTQDQLYDERLQRAERLRPLPLGPDYPWRRAAFKISHSYFVDHTLPEARDVITALQTDRYFMRFGSLEASEARDNQWHPDDFLIVPLTFRDVELGWISVDCPHDQRRPTLARVQEIEIFAEQLVQALVNKRLYNQAEQDRYKLMAVLDGINDGVLAFDLQDRLLFSNRAVEAVLGMALPHIPGVSVQALLVESPLLDFLTDEESRAACTVELSLPDQGRTLLVNVTPLPQTGRVVVMRDITYFREMEHLRMELLRDLSHDLKSPLTAIDVTAALIERSGKLNPQQHDYVERLRGATQRAVAMIGGLLDMARLESGERVPHEPCVISDLISDVAYDLEVAAGEKDIEINYDVAELPVVFGDSLRLRQVLANLIGNAVKYTPEGGRIVVEAHQQNGSVHVSVIDSGVGISPEHLPHIFDRFYRVNPGAETEGTGLGLSIVKTVVERHGGQVWVESEPGKGSHFTFTVPLRSPAI